MKKAIALICMLAFAFASVAEAKGRTGSKRAGGYNSHGKGSHYVGGYTK